MNLGKTSNGTIYITDEARKANLAVFGIKNTGKAYTLIPYLFEQDLNDKDTGISIIIDTPHLAWFLYAMAKEKGRKVDILKPSVSFDILNQLIFKGEWDHDEIQKIFDYDKAIKEKHVVIVDMEQERFGDKAVRAASMLLLQLQSDMVNERKTRVKHSVYIDNGNEYLPYTKNLLKYGDYYNFFTTMFFKSRTELKDNAILVDNYIRNVMLLQGITWDDAKYFGERMALSSSPYDSAQALMDKNYKEFAYEILSPDGYKRKSGYGELVDLDLPFIKKVNEKSIFWKKRFKPIVGEDQHLQLESEKEALSANTEKTYLSAIEKQVIKDDINSQPLQKNEIEDEHIEKVEDPIETIDIEEPMEEMPQENNFVPNEENVELEIPGIDVSELDIPEEITPQKKKGPQLNQIRKTSSVKFEHNNNLKTLDDFNPNEIITDNDFPDLEIDLDEEPEDVSPETFDLGCDKPEDFVINLGSKGKSMPYQRIKNKKFENNLNQFKGY